MQPTANTANQRDRRLANLKPWKKGQSGNPSGRPKEVEYVKKIAREGSERAIRRLLELVEDDDPRVATVAAKEVLTWAFGSPGKQSNDDEADKRSLTINIVQYSDGNHAPEQLEAKTVSVRPLALS